VPDDSDESRQQAVGLRFGAILGVPFPGVFSLTASAPASSIREPSRKDFPFFRFLSVFCLSRPVQYPAQGLDPLFRPVLSSPKRRVSKDLTA